MNLPNVKPSCPNFGSGPTAKHPGWNLDELSQGLVGRSHRSIQGKEKLRCIIDLTRSILQIPDDYRIAIMPGSATGAIECALWSLLGTREVDIMAFDVFGKLWLIDVIEQLKLENVRTLGADFGSLPDLKRYDPEHDLVFTWNGTTSGVCIPDANWISDNREGLTICDATSSVFCVELPWKKLDATVFSWQKGLGSEAAHGMLVLSPRAIERLETYKPSWPIPRIFRLTKEDKIIQGVFKGDTLNTPSMLCVEDCLKALEWAETIGGLHTLIQRCQKNFKVICNWVERTPWVSLMAESLSIASPSSVCMVLKTLEGKDSAAQRDFLQSMAMLLRQHQAAFDVVNHLYAPPSLRVWCGPTVETQDLQILISWLEWAHYQVLTSL
jgi:phosphoserine aminotransferase